jgi:hypothetical protein
MCISSSFCVKNVQDLYDKNISFQRWYFPRYNFTGQSWSRHLYNNNLSPDPSELGRRHTTSGLLALVLFSLTTSSNLRAPTYSALWACSAEQSRSGEERPPTSNSCIRLRCAPYTTTLSRLWVLKSHNMITLNVYVGTRIALVTRSENNSKVLSTLGVQHVITVGTGTMAAQQQTTWSASAKWLAATSLSRRRYVHTILSWMFTMLIIRTFLVFWCSG